MTEFQFEPKRILKHKNHITLNEGNKYEATVQHLKYNESEDEFTELKKNEAARKYGSKKLVRDLDFKSRDGLDVKETGLGKTPDWFQQILPTINWQKYRTLLYEIDYLMLNMFFVRELYGEERTGREQILELSKTENGIGLDILAELDYSPEYSSTDYDKDEVDGYIKVEIVEEEKEVEGETGREYDTEVDYRQTVFEEDDVVATGLREILTGIALKHDHTGDQLHFSIEEEDGVYTAEILNKDFAVVFNEDGRLQTGVSPWVLEMLAWDGCPVDVEAVEVKN
jgi:hypothetical protein